MEDVSPLFWSPWYNWKGWLSVKYQVTYLLTCVLEFPLFFCLNLFCFKMAWKCEWVYLAPWCFHCASVQVSSVQGGICVLEKAHLHSTPSIRSLPNTAFETVPLFIWLTMALSHSFKEDCLALLLSLPLSSCRKLVVKLICIQNILNKDDCLHSETNSKHIKG